MRIVVQKLWKAPDLGKASLSEILNTISGICPSPGTGKCQPQTHFISELFVRSFWFDSTAGSMLAGLCGCWWLAFELHWLTSWG